MENIYLADLMVTGKYPRFKMKCSLDENKKCLVKNRCGFRTKKGYCELALSMPCRMQMCIECEEITPYLTDGLCADCEELKESQMVFL
jgi:hypothetical protein